MQELDSRIDQLRHQLASLPEHEQIAGLQAERTRLVDQARDAQILVEDLNREQRKADADVEQVKARRERDRSRMDQGLVTNPKDLERMGHELESLERRISSLEDVEIEVMEKLEEAQGALESTGVELRGHRAEARRRDHGSRREGRRDQREPRPGSGRARHRGRRPAR